MIEPVGRFVIRDDRSEDNRRPMSFAIGFFRNEMLNNGVLSPDTIYEVRLIMDELTIKNMGRSMVQTRSGERRNEPHVYGANWNYDLSSMVVNAGNTLILTQEEYNRNIGVVEDKLYNSRRR